jgi:hypothetical protein
LGFDVGGQAGTTVSCLYISAEADEEMPKNKKSGRNLPLFGCTFLPEQYNRKLTLCQLTGPTGHHVRPPYTAGPEKLPMALQDHNHPVRYRNIWLRELK